MGLLVVSTFAGCSAAPNGPTPIGIGATAPATSESSPVTDDEPEVDFHLGASVEQSSPSQSTGAALAGGQVATINALFGLSRGPKGERTTGRGRACMVGDEFVITASFRNITTHQLTRNIVFGIAEFEPRHALLAPEVILPRNNEVAPNQEIHAKFRMVLRDCGRFVFKVNVEGTWRVVIPVRVANGVGIQVELKGVFERNQLGPSAETLVMTIVNNTGAAVKGIRLHLDHADMQWTGGNGPPSTISPDKKDLTFAVPLVNGDDAVVGAGVAIPFGGASASGSVSLRVNVLK
jgi:hypothetical protein